MKKERPQLLLVPLALLCIIFLEASSLASSPSMPGGFISVNTKNNRLIDEDGRERIFHGTNVVYKVPPFIPVVDKFDPIFSYSEEDYKNLQEWGMNAVRLGVMWSGAEPKRGEYNETYLALMQKVVDESAKYGIYTLIDVHQDLFAMKFCGDGVPEWAAIPAKWSEGSFGFPEPLHAPYKYVNGLPTWQDCSKFVWLEYYPTVAVSTAVQNLYDNYDGLQDSFAAYWNKLASMWSTTTSVLGYELMNEPWAGDIYTYPDLLIPGVADVQNLTPMYENLNKAIRAADEKHCIYFEGIQWDDFIVGFNNVPGGAAYQNRSVMSYHVYLPPEISYEEAILVRYMTAQRLKCGWFMTEHNANEPGGFDLCDQYAQGWMGWAFKAFSLGVSGWDGGFYYGNGSLNMDTIKMNSRSYAQAVAGETLSMSFNNSTYEFNLSYKIHKSCTLPTEIYVNQKLFYPEGVNVVLSPPSIAEWTIPEPNKVHIIPLASTQDLTVLNVTITPK